MPGLLILTLTSCYSYRTHFTGAVKKDFNSIEKPVAYVTNATAFPKEFKILKKSGLYNISRDSLSARQLTLARLERYPVLNCITGEATFIFFTLGQWPVSKQETHTFSFLEVMHQDSVHVSYDLHIEKRLWFWNIFSPRKSLTSALAKEVSYTRVNRSVSTVSKEKQQP